MPSLLIFASARWELAMQFLSLTSRQSKSDRYGTAIRRIGSQYPIKCIFIAWLGSYCKHTYPADLHTVVCGCAQRYGTVDPDSHCRCTSRLQYSDAVSPKVAKNQLAISLAAGIPSQMTRPTLSKAAEPLPKSGPSHNRLRAFCATQFSGKLV